MNKAKFLRRPNILPKNSKEYPLFLFISLVIPLTYWFEIWVVLPSLFSNYPVFYWFAFILGHFILHNVVGNFLGILMFDTSIRGRVMPSEGEPGARYCAQCQTVTPPRSFHCPSCDICILKRDHHCIFTSCCVGFYNHRFFFYFVFYLMVATILCTPFNIYFIKDKISLSDLNFIYAIVFPIALFILDFGSENIEIHHIYFMISALGFVGIMFCSVWFYFHLKLILKGSVVHEMRKCINMYNLGKEKNLEMVFGNRWHLTWVTPFLNSPLPCDGVSFPVLEGNK